LRFTCMRTIYDNNDSAVDETAMGPVQIMHELSPRALNVKTHHQSRLLSEALELCGD
jgi:hypothetical protein